jgi:A/G-specific adenine glycosylase
MTETHSKFTKTLIKWYLQNKRNLPWRNTKDPYTIWLSEIILQQTRVAQGLPYYNTFINEFPTVTHLAAASEDKILKLWQGLGYYSRARNLHQTAKYIVSHYNGVFPKEYKSLLALKGVGDYTASAIASICFNAPEAVVDGNVYRVLSRYFGIETPIDTTVGKKQFKVLAQSLIEKDNPGVFNQSLMEFGARYCVPANPDCQHCIFSDSCWALQHNKVTTLPKKSLKQKIKKRYFNYLVIVSEDNHTIIKQRQEKDIWQQLYEFPLIETTKKITKKDLLKTKAYRQYCDQEKDLSVTLFNTTPIVHKLSHQHLITFFWIIQKPTINHLEGKILLSNLKKYPVPVLVANFINTFFKN